MTMLSGGEAIVKSLSQYGVDTVFGLPGAQLDFIFDALYHEQDSIRTIQTRHEQATAYMAMGYAKATGREGVCLVVPGPGLLNAAGALSTAWAVNAPVLCISGQIASTMIDKGTGQLHEIPDQLGMISHITKWAARIGRPSEAPAIVQEAFRQLRTGRIRPVEIEMPPDIMEFREEVTLYEPVNTYHADVPEGDPELIEKAAKILGSATNPVICVGGGAMAAHAEIKQLAETLQAPVIMSTNGLGVLDYRHPLALTSIGGREIWADVDAVIGIGTRMQRQLDDWGVDDDLAIIRIDIDDEEITRFGEPNVGIVADARIATATLVNQVEKYTPVRESREEEMLAVKAKVDDILYEVQPLQSFTQVIREELPEDGIYIGDITQMGAFSEFGYPVYHPRTYIGSGFQGTLGYGFPTALGAQAAYPDRKVVSVNGDGGFMYAASELATAYQHHLPLIIVIMNDGAFGNVKLMQKRRAGGRHIAADLINPDFVKLAESFNIEGRRAETADQLREALKDGMESNAPMLIDMPTPPLPATRQMARGRIRGS